MFGEKRLIQNPSCPVCGSSEWRELGRHTYRLKDKERQPPYIRNRYRAIFEVLSPGSDEFETVSQLCLTCGFILHTPRQTSEDRSAVYGFLGSITDNAPSSPYRAEHERRRAHRLYGRVNPHLAGKTAILDYGGSDGRLLKEFASNGAVCHLIDYCRTPIAGVTSIGRDEADIPRNAAYGAVICSHVLEHLAEPFDVVKALAESLQPGGIMYAEVPMEIWRRPPAPKEPITHVNYFTPATLSFLLERAGLHVLSARLISYIYGSGSPALAVECIGTKRSTVRANPPGAKEAERFLDPDLALGLKRAWLIPNTVARNVLGRAVARRPESQSMGLR